MEEKEKEENGDKEEGREAVSYATTLPKVSGKLAELGKTAVRRRERQIIEKRKEKKERHSGKKKGK